MSLVVYLVLFILPSITSTIWYVVAVLLTKSIWLWCSDTLVSYLQSQRQPVLTGMATTTTIAICGDIGSQYFSHQYQQIPFRWNFRRTAKFGLCGLLIAPQMVHWLTFLKRSFPEHSTRTAVKRLCVDQMVFSSYVSLCRCKGFNLHIHHLQLRFASDHVHFLPFATTNQIFVHVLSRQLLYFGWRQFQRRTETIEDQVVWLISSFYNLLASILVYHVHGDPATSPGVVDQRGVIGMVCIYFTQSAWMKINMSFNAFYHVI